MLERVWRKDEAAYRHLIDASMLLMFCVVWVFQMDRYKEGAGPLELLQAICVCHDGAWSIHFLCFKSESFNYMMHFFVCLLPKCVPFRASFNSCWYIDCVLHLLWVERAQVWEFSPLMAFIIDMLVLSSNTVAIKGASFLLFLIALPWWLVPSLSLSQCIAS